MTIEETRDTDDQQNNRFNLIWGHSDLDNSANQVTMRKIHMASGHRWGKYGLKQAL